LSEQSVVVTQASDRCGRRAKRKPREFESREPELPPVAGVKNIDADLSEGWKSGGRRFLPDAVNFCVNARIVNDLERRGA